MRMAKSNKPKTEKADKPVKLNTELNIESNDSKKIVSNGSKVSLDYEGRLESGEIFDTSKHGDHSHPLEFEVGSGQVIPGFDKAVLGMKVGEEKEFSIEPEEAYGNVNPELKKEIPKNALPKEQEPKPGMTLIVSTPQGQFPVKILEVNKDDVVIDLNHPLAGKKLIFKIKLLEIK
jgi:FKBP-type peptidyl-prolyl cis-trans isomerase 2